MIEMFSIVSMIVLLMVSALVLETTGKGVKVYLLLLAAWYGLAVWVVVEWMG